jgi:hypothetical protein
MLLHRHVSDEEWHGMKGTEATKELSWNCLKAEEQYGWHLIRNLGDFKSATLPGNLPVV